MALSGVRSSWLMLARNWDLAKARGFGALAGLVGFELLRRPAARSTSFLSSRVRSSGSRAPRLMFEATWPRYSVEAQRRGTAVGPSWSGSPWSSGVDDDGAAERDERRPQHEPAVATMTSTQASVQHATRKSSIWPVARARS
jgi:hypothetical protein